MIPLATTTITVLRADYNDRYNEPYSGNDNPTSWGSVATGVRAVIDRPTGREQVAGGEQNRVDLSLVCDSCDLNHLDGIRDERTNVTYRVVWVLDYGSHIEGGLQIVQGVV